MAVYTGFCSTAAAARWQPVQQQAANRHCLHQYVGLIVSRHTNVALAVPLRVSVGSVGSALVCLQMSTQQAAVLATALCTAAAAAAAGASYSRMRIVQMAATEPLTLTGTAAVSRGGRRAASFV